MELAAIFELPKAAETEVLSIDGLAIFVAYFSLVPVLAIITVELAPRREFFNWIDGIKDALDYLVIVGLIMFEAAVTVALVDLIYGLTIAEVNRDVWEPLNLVYRVFLVES